MLYLKAGDTVTLYDLCVGMMLASGNDCANAVAFTLSGSLKAFADLMNSTASKLSMNNTHFITPSGLDEDKPIRALMIWHCFRQMLWKTNIFLKLFQCRVPKLQ